MSNARKGFTLLELIVVMMLLFLMGGVVAPRFVEFVPSLRVDRSARDVLAAARKARSDAVLLGRIVRLVVNPEERTVAIEVQGNPFKDPDTYARPVGAWSEPITFPHGVDLAAEGAEDGSFEFRPDGTATEGTIVVSNSRGRRQTVRITAATGKAVIEEVTEDSP